MFPQIYYDSKESLRLREPMIAYLSIRRFCLAAFLIIIVTSCARTQKSSTTEGLKAKDPLYQVEDNGKIGFIDRKGTVIIKPQFEDVYFQIS